MTRETKIGLMVAVSFICLVGVVVATRWRRDNPNQIADIKPKEPAPAASGDNPASSGGNNKNPVLQVGGFNNQAPGSLPIGPDNTPPLVAISSPGNSNSADPAVPALPGLPMNDIPPPPQIGGIPSSSSNPGGNNAGLSTNGGINLPPPPQIGGNNNVASAQNASGNIPPPPGVNNPTTPTFPTTPIGNDEALRAQLQTFKNEQDKLFAQNSPMNDLTKNLPMPGGSNPPAPPSPPGFKDNGVPLPPVPVGNNSAPTVTQSKDNNVPFPSATPGQNSAPTVPQIKDNNVPFPAMPPGSNPAPTLPQTKDNNIPFPPAPLGNNSAPTVTQSKDNNIPFPPAPLGNNSAPTVTQSKDNNVPFPPAPLGNNSAPPIPAPKNSDLPFASSPGSQSGNTFSGVPAPQSNNNFGSAPPGGNNNFGPPSVGGNIKNTSSQGFTIPAPNASGASVESYDMRKYTIRGGETFPGLSNYFYQSEKYADALLAFNRDHGNPGLSTLQPGQIILAPSADYLQRSYGSMIAGNRAASGAQVAINQPIPLTPRNNFGSTTPSPDATKTYRVSGESQMIWQVAVQTLGDGNRWPEILRLNPGLQTLQPIPGGTTLRMPGNANVP